MRKTAILLLLIMILFTLSFEVNVSSSSLDKSKIEAFNYTKFKENQELDRRALVEKQMLDSLYAKESIKWVFTGFNDAQLFFESSGSQDAVSEKGATGIAQFMPGTWSTLIEMRLLPPWFDINNEAHQRIAQLVYLDYLYDMWDTQVAFHEKLITSYLQGYDSEVRLRTIASYNAGPNRVKRIVAVHGKAWKSHLPLETRNYLIKLKPYI